MLEKDDLEEHEIRKLEQWTHLSALPVKRELLLQSNGSLVSQGRRGTPGKRSNTVTPGKTSRGGSYSGTPSKKKAKVELINP